jgi:hypothetical protein
MAVARAVLSAISRFVSAMAMLNFGGQQTVSTSVQNFVRMTLRKRSFVCSIPPRLQVLRPPIQPNHRLLNSRASTGPAGWPDLAQCWREIRGPPCDRLAHWDHQHGVPPSLAILSWSISRCRAEARMGHSHGACWIVCSRSRGSESMAFPARRPAQ